MSAHGIMFHHFCDDEIHLRGQGAINESELETILDYLKDFNILKAHIWLEKAINNKLNDNDICLTFDDGLKCQYDVALPVLEKRDLTAFWFVYSNIYHGFSGRLELYRYYRTAFFENIDDFYKSFFELILHSKLSHFVEESLKGINIKNYLHEFNFYTFNDRKFRYIRDKILGPENYFIIMDQMIKNDDIDIDNITKQLWMDEKSLKELEHKDHIIGLHSYSHPTEISSLTKYEQHKEYKMNYNHLFTLLKKKPVVMSHPCNSYNEDTLDILKSLDVKIGFRSNSELANFSMLEFPRVDHSILMKNAIPNFN